jgi:ABC transporter substrate binding protein
VKNRVPAIVAGQAFAEAGGLMSYGLRMSDIFRRAANQIDKILRGAKPADLAVEQPTKFELVINLKTAKALGLTIPQSVLVRADKLIERGRLAKPDDDAAVNAQLGDMDVGLLDRTLKSAIRQLIVDGLIVLTDLRPELPAGNCGHRRHLFVTGQCGLDVLGAGNGRHHGERQGKEEGEQPLRSRVSHFFTPSRGGEVAPCETDVPV